MIMNDTQRLIFMKACDDIKCRHQTHGHGTKLTLPQVSSKEQLGSLIDVRVVDESMELATNENEQVVSDSMVSVKETGNLEDL